MPERALGTGEVNDPGASAPRVISGRYRIVRLLGEGTSARTLLCDDLRDGRRVAVKELRFEHLEDWKYLELFEREATMLSRLDHPAVPRVFDFFQEEDSSRTFYIVQEFIEGTSLEQRLTSGPMLGRQELQELTMGLLEVLDYLHSRVPPVLHRDIKPPNILLRHDAPPTLIDFGGVCVGWRPPGVAGTTVVGTFGYMPPEQLVGQAGPTSDLYSLGATLLHLVTGRPPSDFPFDSGRIEVPPGLPVDAPFASLIEALLRPAPRDRPQTVAAARRILAASPQRGSRSLADRIPPTATLPASRTGDGPRFVDLGPPPRDPDGEFKDVYRNLIHPLFPARRLWGPLNHLTWVASSAVLSVLTMGIAPAVYAWQTRARLKKYADLFRHGQVTHGVIRSVEVRQSSYHTFKYDYEVADVPYVGFMDYAHEMARYWDHGDAVPVLYDPNDPSRSCFVYR